MVWNGYMKNVRKIASIALGPRNNGLDKGESFQYYVELYIKCNYRSMSIVITATAILYSALKRIAKLDFDKRCLSPDNELHPSSSYKQKHKLMKSNNEAYYEAAQWRGSKSNILEKWVFYVLFEIWWNEINTKKANKMFCTRKSSPTFCKKKIIEIWLSCWFNLIKLHLPIVF